MRRPLSLRLYAVTAALLSPAIPLLLSWRAWRGKEDQARLGERMGRPGVPRPSGDLIWLHGASVGEGLTLASLATALLAERPGIAVLITSGTRAAAQVLAGHAPPASLHQYAPVDSPAAVRRFLSHWRPQLAVFVESELWPNLLLAAQARGVRVALLSARMSQASLRGWRRFPRAAQTVLGAFDLIMARDQEAAARFEELGARIAGVADLKTGAEPLPVDRDELARLRSALAGRTVLLAASTHQAEDEIVLEAFREVLNGVPHALLIIAPRHLERGPDIELLARERNLRTARRASAQWAPALQCVVADTLGELGLWYRLAGAALVGGSLVPGAGGHNPFEPARLGCPVAHGPRTAQWPVYDELDKRGAARLVTSAAELAAVFQMAAANGGVLRAMAEAARDYAAERDAENAGLPARLLALIAP